MMPQQEYLSPEIIISFQGVSFVINFIDSLEPSRDFVRYRCLAGILDLSICISFRSPNQQLICAENKTQQADNVYTPGQQPSI